MARTPTSSSSRAHGARWDRTSPGVRHTASAGSGPPVARRTAAAGQSLALLHRTRVARADDHDRLSVYRLRKEGRGRRHPEDHDGRQLVGRGPDEVAVETQDLTRLRGRVEHHAGQDDRSDGVQTILEGCDHREVAAATAEPPEEVGVLLGAGAKELAV